MKLTVEDVLKLEPLTDAVVVAGHRGLSNVVTSVSVLEVPKATSFIKEGQMEISAFYSIADNIDAQLELVRALKKCKASGLILSHVGIILPSISKRLMDLCDELAFPLIHASPNVAYIDIISPILNSLIKMQNQKLEHAMRIYDKMTSLILEEKDFDGIIAALGRLIKRKVYFFNYDNTCVSSSHDSLSPEYEIYIKQNIQDYLNKFITEKKDVYITGMDQKTLILLAPVVSSMMYYGVMVILDASGLNDLDYISIAQTKNALGIVTVHRINLKDYNILLKHDYINDIIEWNFSDEATALQRGLALGLDVSRVRICAIVDIFNFSEFSLKYTEKELQKIKSEYYSIISNELSYFAPDSIVNNFSDKVLILFNEEKDKESTKKRVMKISERLRQSVLQALDLPVSVGIGGYYDSISRIRNSYNEALSSLRISNRVFREPRCTSFEEVQVYSLIRDSIDSAKVKMTVNNLLSPIIEYDEKHGTQLLHTFKALLWYELDTKEVADKLFLHKNTVLKRKNKISKLFNYDPFAMPYRLQFKIAIMLDNLLKLDVQ